MQPCRLSRNGSGGGVTKWDVCDSVGLAERSTQLIVVNIFIVRPSSYVHHRSYKYVVQTCVADPFQYWNFVSSAGVQSDIILAFAHLRAYEVQLVFPVSPRSIHVIL